MNKITTYKTTFIVLLYLISFNVISQVGINTITPTKQLDINVVGMTSDGINIQNTNASVQLLSEFDGVTNSLTLNNTQNLGLYRFQFDSTDRVFFTKDGFYPSVNAINNIVNGALDIGRFNLHFRRVYSQAIHTNDNGVEGGLSISIGSSGSVLADYKFSDFAFYPVLSGAKDLGRNGNFWRNFYFVNAFTPSDRRLKNNIKMLDTGLNTLLTIKTYQYYYNFDKSNQLHFGFMAQEIKEKLPHLVSIGEDDDETLSINYNEFIPVLVKAFQEQNEHIKKQESRIKSLEDKLEKS